jgi:hypothetical protein
VRKHAVRYWIERGFQDAKTSLGMTDSGILISRDGSRRFELSREPVKHKVCKAFGEPGEKAGTVK